MMRLPTKLPLFAVPAVCLLLLGAAWAIMRGGGESGERERPTLAILCEESLKLPVTEITTAYERRGGVTVEVELVPSSGIAERLADGSRHDLLFLSADNPAADEWIRQGLIAATEEVYPTMESLVLQSYRLNQGESPDPASRFVEFLSGPFALGILERFKVSDTKP